MRVRVSVDYETKGARVVCGVCGCHARVEKLAPTSDADGVAISLVTTCCRWTHSRILMRHERVAVEPTRTGAPCFQAGEDIERGDVLTIDPKTGHVCRAST